MHSRERNSHTDYQRIHHTGIGPDSTKQPGKGPGQQTRTYTGYQEDHHTGIGSDSTKKPGKGPGQHTRTHTRGGPGSM